jgi:ATP-dependent DNA helicase DinG
MSLMAGLRFTPWAADTLRESIRDAHGVEVFAIGDIEDGWVAHVTVTCRGQQDRVAALLDRPRAGQVVIHNHPSGNLTASDADMQLAALYGEDGVGVVIVDSEVSRSNWVVEPYAPVQRPVDDEALSQFFTEGLSRVMEAYEPRPQQLEMARQVAASLSDRTPLLVEAGTGTGKSLAYLAPAALWATANQKKVVVSTHTRALQGQLLHADLPLLTRGGIAVKTAVLQGRANYLCKRRLALVDEDERGSTDRVALDAILAWDKQTSDGSRSDIAFELDPALWDRVLSDSDLSLRIRCPHYGECHYYQARRAASAAHIVVVNHALLLADLRLRAEIGRGVLPKYDRIILDEAHHLEDSATGAVTRQLTAFAVRRAVSPLLDGKRRRGALSRLVDHHGGENSVLDPAGRTALQVGATAASTLLRELVVNTDALMAQLAEHGLESEDAPRRWTDADEDDPLWRSTIAPDVASVAAEVESVTEHLDAVEALFSDVQVPEAQAQPLLDLRRGRRRLTSHAEIARSFLEFRQEWCRWIDRARSRKGARTAQLNVAPVAVAATLKEILWEPLPGAVCTSATLSLSGNFSWWQSRHGLDDPTTALFPSPFDHAKQAILALPRELPEPNDPDFLRKSAACIEDVVRISDGGAFVLCTSHRAVRHYSDALRRGLGTSWPVISQGQASRVLLLQRFRENRRAILVGTDSFWEGVSVQGDGLRLVIIPRLPFRVPTDPLRMARHEAIASRGKDPFLAYSLPEAVIKLRQGYGRLIRSHQDVGAVVLLDRRIHERRYGRIMMRSLPPARRVMGSWRQVCDALRQLYGSP